MARVGLFDHRKFKRLAAALGGRAIALGSLELMWHTCYQTADDFLGDETDVEAAAEWRGKSGKLCEALMASGFIDKHDDGYRVHDLFDHAPEHVKRKVEREIARKQSGESLAEARSRAGKCGRAKQLGGQTSASGGQTSDTCPDLPASGGQVAGKSGTSGGVGWGGVEESIAAEKSAAGSKRRGRPPADPMPFTLPHAMDAIRHGVLVDPFPREPKYAKNLTALIRQYPDLATWRLVADHVATRSTKPTLLQFMTQFGAWLQEAKSAGPAMRNDAPPADEEPPWVVSPQDLFELAKRGAADA